METKLIYLGHAINGQKEVIKDNDVEFHIYVVQTITEDKIKHELLYGSEDPRHSAFYQELENSVLEFETSTELNEEDHYDFDDQVIDIFCDKSIDEQTISIIIGYLYLYESVLFSKGE